MDKPPLVVVQQLLISAQRKAIRLITCVKLYSLGRGPVTLARSLGVQRDRPVSGKAPDNEGSGGASGPNTAADSGVLSAGDRVGRTTGRCPIVPFKRYEQVHSLRLFSISNIKAADANQSKVAYLATVR